MSKNGFITLLVVLVITALIKSIVIVRDTEKAILLKTDLAGKWNQLRRSRWITRTSTCS